MKGYADTGFLVKLFLIGPESSQAIAAMQKTTMPVILSWLSTLELRNALYLNVFQRRISEETRRAAWRAFENDLEAGIYVVGLISTTELNKKAAWLADKYSASRGTRSLDLLHVAAALLLEADTMLSFDARQRFAAQGEGLKLKP